MSRYAVDESGNFGGDERRRLETEIGLVRRRIVAARAQLALVQDPELERISTAQRILVEERRETDRVMGFRERERTSARPATSSADQAWLQSELDRLVAKADALEREVERLAAAGPRPAPPGLELLESMLAGALVGVREDHRRAREQATQLSDQLRVVAEESRGRVASSPAAERRVAALEETRGRVEDWPPGNGATRIDPGIEPFSPPPPPREAQDEPVLEPSKAKGSKPMILDVVLPLIAVAIVLLIVLSWMG